MDRKTYTAEVIEEDGELMLTFPPEMTAELGWQEGDTITWEQGPNGTYLLARKAKPDELSNG
jgi:hypothetical protein